MASTGTAGAGSAASELPLKTGMLLKQGHVVKSWKERLFVLAHGKLCYYDLPVDHSEDFRGVSPLGTIRLADVKSVAATRNHCTFKVCVVANPASGQVEREYMLVAATDRERDDWLAALRRAIFSPGRAVELLRTAIDMQSNGRLCSREVDLIKSWLKGGSDAELGLAAGVVSDASVREGSDRASDACESLLLDFKAARTSAELLGVLSSLRQELRDEEDGWASSASTGGGGGEEATRVPTDSYRERLLQCAMEHIGQSNEEGSAMRAGGAEDGGSSSSSGLTGGGVSENGGATPPVPPISSAPQLVADRPVLTSSSSSSWLPSFSLLSSSASQSTDSLRAGLDRSNSRGSTISRSDSSLRAGPASPAVGGAAGGSGAGPRWSADVQDGFALVLHQIAMRVAIAEERAAATSSTGSRAVPDAAPAPPPAEKPAGLAVRTVVDAPLAGEEDAASVTADTTGGDVSAQAEGSGLVHTPPVVDLSARHGVVPPESDPSVLAPAAVPPAGKSSGEGASSGAALPAAVQTDDAEPALTVRESLDDLLERSGLADDLRRLQRARVAGSPAMRRSRGESGASHRSGRTGGSEEGGEGQGAPIRRPSDGTSAVAEDEEEGDPYGEGADEGGDQPTAAYLRGPTARARAVTAASVQLFRTLSQAGGLPRDLSRKLTHAASLLSTARHSTKVAAAAAEAAEAGMEAPILQISPDDPDPCAALREEVPFSSVYTLGDRIGEGAYSLVYRGTHRATGEAVAVKVAQKAAMTPVEQRRLLEEVRVMSALDHDHIVRLQAFYEDGEAYYIVSELCTGGELFDKIVTRSTYSEREAREVVRTVAEAVAYMHAHGVVHRDLKPENVLLSSPDDETAIIRIADMGFAKVVPRGGALRTSCGTPSYVAPEILEGRPYDTAVDMWSLGVITYILLAGYAPFHARNQTELFRSIVAGRYYFDSPYWDGVSSGAKDLIRKLLLVDPVRRITAEQVLAHRWLHGTVSAVELTSAVQQLRISQSSRREVLKAGELTKRGAIFWSWRVRTFVLTSETLEYYDSAEYAEGSNSLARPKGVINLKDIESVKCLDGAGAAAVAAPSRQDGGAAATTAPTPSGASPTVPTASSSSSSSSPDGPWVFTVRVGGGREYVLSSSTSEAERSEWVRAISSARAHSDLVRKALMAKEAHADTDLVALMKLAATWRELVGVPEGGVLQ